MDKAKEMITYSHAIQMTERKSMLISGIKKLENFDDKEFFLESNMGYILIKGSELELVKLDTFQGTVSIKGKIDSIMYLDSETKKSKNESVISRLFKWLS